MYVSTEKQSECIIRIETYIKTNLGLEEAAYLFHRVNVHVCWSKTHKMHFFYLNFNLQNILKLYPNIYPKVVEYLLSNDCVLNEWDERADNFVPVVQSHWIYDTCSLMKVASFPHLINACVFWWKSSPRPRVVTPLSTCAEQKKMIWIKRCFAYY